MDKFHAKYRSAQSDWSPSDSRGSNCEGKTPLRQLLRSAKRHSFSSKGLPGTAQPRLTLGRLMKSASIQILGSPKAALDSSSERSVGFLKSAKGPRPLEMGSTFPVRRSRPRKKTRFSLEAFKCASKRRIQLMSRSQALGLLFGAQRPESLSGPFPVDESLQRSLERFAKTFAGVARKSSSRALARLRAHCAGLPPALETVAGRDFRRQMHRIAAFSEAIAWKCGRLEQSSASFARDKRVLLDEIGRLGFFVKHSLLQFEAGAGAGEEAPPSPPLSGFDTQPGRLAFKSLFKKKPEGPLDLSDLPSTRNCSAANCGLANLCLASPLKGGSRLWGGGSMPTLFSIEAREGPGEPCQVRPLGLSHSSQNHLVFEKRATRRSKTGGGTGRHPRAEGQRQELVLASESGSTN